MSADDRAKKADQIKRAILWGLKIPTSGRVSDSQEQVSKDWENILLWLKADPAKSRKLAELMVPHLMNIMEPAKQQKPASAPPAPANAKPPAKTAGDEVREAVVVPPTRPVSDPARASKAPARTAASEADTLPLVEESEETEETMPAKSDKNKAGADAPRAEADAKPSPDPITTSKSPAPQWKWLPLPDDPDRHGQFHSQSLPPTEATSGLKLIGARARGKKHKHEGTNCDDWFEFDVSGDWTIIAVSDGAGSKKFSRVGAEAACKTAVETLAKELKGHSLKKVEDWAAGALQRDDAGTFPEADLEAVQRALHAAMQRAYKALLGAAQQRAESDAHKAVLGRGLEPDDLSATLLLAVHAQVEHGGGRRSFVLTCQVGDGMLCAVDTRGQLTPLAQPDSGEFAGQTDFLTSKNKLERESLIHNTHGFIGSLQALMVMTDGVADDYYPSSPNLLRLYGDLVLNGIITLEGPDGADINFDEMNAALAATKLKTLDDVQDAKEEFGDYVENVVDGEGKTRKTFIRSSQKFADALNVPLEELVTQPALLMAGAQAGMIDEQCPDERCFHPDEKLLMWIDSYHVRGSFDDRTLVVLYRESAA